MSGGAQPQEMAPVLLAKYGVEDRKGGSGGRGGAHPVRLSESPMKFLPNHLFAPAEVTEDLVRRFQTKVAGAWLRGEVAGQ